MGAGRFACVALPLALTIASIVCLLMAMLGQITDKNLALFEVRTQNLSISSSSLENLVDLATRDVDLDLSKLTNEALRKGEDLVQAAKDAGVKTEDLVAAAKNAGVNAGTEAIAGGNLTASTLGLADYYRVALWNYCSWTDGKRECSKAKFDWASGELNTTLTYQVNGQATRVSLPKEVRGALKTFATVSKWTQVVYIVAIIAAAIELVCGIFAICSRMGSCCTAVICSIATTAIICASILATVQATVVTGAVKTTARAYNVNGSLNTRFLTITWLAAVFSLGAGLFWLFTTCCCGSDSKSSKSHGNNKGFNLPFGKRTSRHSDQEKFIPTGSYQRVGDDNTAYHGQQQGVHHNGQEFGVPMHNVKPVARGGNGAYEPYAHTRV